MIRGQFLENANIVSAFVPVNMAGAANNGDWVNLSKFGRLVAVLFKGAGTAGEDPIFTLRQATDAAGSGAKALNFTEVWEKVGAQTGIANFTRVQQTAASTYVNAASAEAEGVFAVEIRAEDLDVEGGFTHVQLQVPDVGAGAQNGCGFYVMLDPRHAGASLESAIA